jgi:AcrR family transcriptional regulator
MATTDAVTDGRRARSRRTGAAIVTALVELILEGDPAPTAQEIAARADLSVRSVFSHFRTLEDLHMAAVDQVAVMVVERLAPIDPDDRLDARVDLLASQRSRINEELGPLLLAAERLESSSPSIARSRRRSRKASRQQIERVFASELGDWPEGTRQRRVATIEALLGTASWNVLRACDLTVDEARVAVSESIIALVRAP